MKEIEAYARKAIDIVNASIRIIFFILACNLEVDVWLVYKLLVQGGVDQILSLPAYLMHLYVYFIDSDSAHMTGFSRDRSMMQRVLCQNVAGLYSIH